jgi:hypothetical protein
MNVAKKNSKNAAICARNYANREKDVYDTLHVKGLKEVKGVGLVWGILDLFYLTRVLVVGRGN